ncbi:MAG: dTDP-4-dehydrorhamnose 3,5-epimerase [Chromatiaceae bacterium]|nr:dTDP-4-dehydrorhamnose 3,5-epimerase [Chromatiaceae bacterium]
MKLDIIQTAIPGCYELQPSVFQDSRGIFVKTYHADQFQESGLRTDWAEQYYTNSAPGVLRGLHFQLPPRDHAKLVYCIAGRVLDVAVDLRVGSPSYGRYVKLELSAARGNMMYLAAGLAHGFCTQDEPATLVYNVTSIYQPEGDAGIRWDSVNIPWPLPRPLLSGRDQGFPTLAEFDSPFVYQAEYQAGISG